MTDETTPRESADGANDKPTGLFTWDQVLKAAGTANVKFGAWMPQQWIDHLNEALRALPSVPDSLYGKGEPKPLAELRASYERFVRKSDGDHFADYEGAFRKWSSPSAPKGETGSTDNLDKLRDGIARSQNRGGDTWKVRIDQTVAVAIADELQQLRAERDAMSARAEDATEYVLAQINADLRARIAALELTGVNDRTAEYVHTKNVAKALGFDTVGKALLALEARDRLKEALTLEHDKHAEYRALQDRTQHASETQRLLTYSAWREAAEEAEKLLVIARAAAMQRGG